MSKVVRVELDMATAEVSVDLTGFQGKGCEDITRGLASALGTQTEFTRKPEYNQVNTGLLHK